MFRSETLACASYVLLAASFYYRDPTVLRMFFLPSNLSRCVVTTRTVTITFFPWQSSLCTILHNDQPSSATL